MDRHLERIYGYSSDPNEGKWFVSDNHNYTRFINGYRETIHKVKPNSFDLEPWENPDEDKWTVSIGGPGNKFQVGYKYFNNTTEAKKWADNRDQEDLDILENIINGWRNRNNL